MIVLSKQKFQSVSSRFDKRRKITGGILGLSIASVILITLLMVLSSVPTRAAAKTWDRGGGTNNWSNPTNWSPDGVPGISDTVTIGTGYTVVVDGDNRRASSLTIDSGASVTISGNQFWVTTVTNNGTLTASGSPNYCTFSTLNNNSTINLNVNNPSYSYPMFVSTLNNTGTINVSGGNRLSINSSANNSGTIHITNKNNGTNYGLDFNSSAGNFLNTGDIYSSGTAEISIYVDYDGATNYLDNNGGSIHVEGTGKLTVMGKTVNRNSGEIYTTAPNIELQGEVNNNTEASIYSSGNGYVSIFEYVGSDEVYNDNAAIYGTVGIGLPLNNTNGGTVYSETGSLYIAKAINDNSTIYATDTAYLQFSGEVTNRNDGSIYIDGVDRGIYFYNDVTNDGGTITASEGWLNVGGSLDNLNSASFGAERTGSYTNVVVIEGDVTNDNSSEIYLSNGDGDIKISGSFVNSDASTLTMVGGGKLDIGGDYSNTNGSILDGQTATGTWFFRGDFLNDSTSRVIASQGNMGFYKNFTNQNPSSDYLTGFYHNQGTIELLGSEDLGQTISGNNTYYNFIHNRTESPIMNEHQTVVYNGYVYSIGGADESWDRVDRVLYAKINSDGSVSKFNATTSMSKVRSSFGAFAYNGKLYVLGGSDQTGNYYDDVEYADINPDGTIGAWQSTESFDSARSDFALSFYVYDSNHAYVYISGGSDGSGDPFDDVQFAEINSDGTLSYWQTTTSLNTAVEYHQMVSYNGRLYNLGGYDGGDTLNNVDVANINSDGTIGSWQPTTSFSTPLATFGAAVNNGYIYVVGGDDWDDAVAEVEYAQVNPDGSIGAWSLTEPLPYKVAQATVNVSGGRLYEFGGWDYERDVPDNSFTTFNTDGTLDPWAINYAPPVPLNIEAGTTQTFAGDVSLRGNVGDRLSISSTSDGDRFNVEFEGDSDISYVNVKDSSNTYGPPIIARRSTDGHNNVGWIFGYQIVATHNGSGAVSPSDTTYSEVGDSKTFTITPSSGNSIADVFVDGSSVGAVSSYVFSDIVSDHTISATFVPNTTPSTSHKLNISATEGGNVSPSGKVSVKNGASVVVTATPKSGYYVNGYSSDAKVSCAKSGISSICTVSNITTDKYFMAKFAKNPTPTPPSVPTEDSTQTKKYNIYTKINSIGSKDGGRIDSNCSRTPLSGDVCRYDFISADNFKLKEVVLDGRSLGWKDTYTIDGVNSDHTIEATFVEQYEVSIVDQDHLTIETNDDSSAEHGDDYTFTIKADDGFAIKDVLANGVSIKSNCVISGDEANCTIKNVMSKQSIGAVLGASDSTDEQDGKNNAITAAIGLFILPFTSAGDVLSTTFKSMPKPIAYTLPWLLFMLLAIVTYMIIKYWKKRIGQRN